MANAYAKRDVYYLGRSSTVKTSRYTACGLHLFNGFTNAANVSLLRHVCCLTKFAS